MTRLGLDTASLSNFLMANALVPQGLKVGDGATYLMYTDRHACTVVELDEKRLVIQRDHAKRTDSHGMSDSQNYEYSPDPEGVKHVFTMRRNGRWTEEGYKAGEGSGVLLGHRDHHRDFTF